MDADEEMIDDASGRVGGRWSCVWQKTEVWSGPTRSERSLVKQSSSQQLSAAGVTCERCNGGAGSGFGTAYEHRGRALGTGEQPIADPQQEGALERNAFCIEQRS